MIPNLFHLDMTILEKVLRTLGVYVFLIVGLRLAGKRELAQLNPFDLVVLLTLSNALQNAIIGNDNSLIGGFIGAATLLFLNYVVVRFLYGHKKIERVVEGDATVLIQHGRILRKNLERELISEAELEVAAHRQGFGSLKDIDRAVLETGGGISFFAHKPEPELERHGQLLGRLDALSKELAAVKASLSK